MEILIFIGIGAIIYWVVKSGSETNAASAQPKARSSLEEIKAKHPFTIRAETAPFKLDDGQIIEVLKLQIRGLIDSEYRSLEQDSLKFTASMRVEDENMPVICAIEDLQEGETPFFHFKSEVIKSFHGLAHWEDWATLFVVPTAALSFPRSGSQNVKIQVVGAYRTAGRSVLRTCRVLLESWEQGYLDSLEQRSQSAEVAVELAVLVAGLDGVRDTDEAQIVTAFIRKECNSRDDESNLKNRLNEAVRKAHSIHEKISIRKSGFKLAEEAKKFEASAKFKIMELLFDVAGADGVAAHAETEFLNEIAHLMGLDIAEYKNMRDKALRGLDYETSEVDRNRQLEDMLGIRAEMSVHEKKKQLSSEFRKWNALANSSDPAKKKQAKEMVAAIKTIRNQL